MIRTGSSLMQAAKAYRAAGASDIIAITTHGLFPADSLAAIRQSRLLRKIVVPIVIREQPVWHATFSKSERLPDCLATTCNWATSAQPHASKQVMADTRSLDARSLEGLQQKACTCVKTFLTHFQAVNVDSLAVSGDY